MLFNFIVLFKDLIIIDYHHAGFSELVKKIDSVEFLNDN
jgi:hypothetical protein